MLFDSKSVDPRSECLEPVKGGGLPPSYPPPLDPFVDSSVQNPGGQPSKCEPQPPGRPRPAKTTHPNTGPSRGSLWDPPEIFSVGVRGFGAALRHLRSWAPHFWGWAQHVWGCLPRVPKVPHGSAKRSHRRRRREAPPRPTARKSAISQHVRKHESVGTRMLPARSG